MLNDGLMVRSVPSSVSSARDSTVIAFGTSRPCRFMTSSIMLMAFGSKLPDPDALGEHEPDVGLERAAVAAVVAAGEVHARAREDHGIVELEADRHLLERLEHDRG